MAFHKRLFFLLLVLLPTQLSLHFWPMWTVVLGRKIDYLSPTIFLTDVLLVSLLGSFVTSRWSEIKTEFLRIYSPKILLGVCVFLSFVCINIWAADAPEISMYKWVKFLEFAALAWYIIFTKPSLQTVAGAISIGIFYTSVITIIQFVLQRSVGSLMWYLGERMFSLDTPGIARFSYCSPFVSECRLILRPYATFPHPNVLGGFLATALPLHVFAFPLRDGNKQSFFRIAYFWGTIVLGCVALVFTFSRGAWIATTGMFSVIVSVSILDKIKNLTQPGKFIGVFVGILALIVAVFFTLAVAFRPGITDESVVRRVELNTAALSVWRSSPIVGVGLGNFLSELPKQISVRQINFLQPVHNIYLLMLSEVGVIGLAAFVVLHIVLMKRAIRDSLTHSNFLNQTRFAYLLPYCFLLVLGSIDHFPLTLQQGQLWLVVLFALVWQSEKK